MKWVELRIEPSGETGEIKLSTNDKELFERVEQYVRTCVNAINYERQIILRENGKRL